jgi:hypothetical protein
VHRPGLDSTRRPTRLGFPAPVQIYFDPRLCYGYYSTPGRDTTTVVSAAAGVAIATVQAATAACHERAMGAVAAAGATTRPRPPFIVAGASAPASPAAAAVGAPGGTVAGHPPSGLLFLAAGTRAPAGPAAGTARPLDATVAVGDPAGTAASAAGPWATTVIAGAPDWLSFDL